jgi:hypothetical protein
LTVLHWTALILILGLIVASLSFLALVIFLGPADSFDIELETEKLEKESNRKIGANTWQ